MRIYSEVETSWLDNSIHDKKGDVNLINKIVELGNEMGFRVNSGYPGSVQADGNYYVKLVMNKIFIGVWIRDDEWIYVNFKNVDDKYFEQGSRSYKCDGFDGLEELLVDINNGIII